MFVLLAFFFNLNSHIFNHWIHIFNQTPKIDLENWGVLKKKLYKKQDNHVPTSNKACNIYLVHLKCPNIISYYWLFYDY